MKKNIVELEEIRDELNLREEQIALKLFNHREELKRIDNQVEMLEAKFRATNRRRLRVLQLIEEAKKINAELDHFKGGK